MGTGLSTGPEALTCLAELHNTSDDSLSVSITLGCGKTPIKYFQILIAGEVILSLKLKLLQGPGRYINGEEAGPGSSE